jgi:hypothetical protein
MCSWLVDFLSPEAPYHVPWSRHATSGFHVNTFFPPNLSDSGIGNFIPQAV